MYWRNILSVLLVLLLFGCVGTKRHKTMLFEQAQQQLRTEEALQQANAKADSLDRALLFSQGGNALLLEAHRQLQDRLIGLEEEQKRLESNLNNTQQSLSERLQNVEAEKQALQQANLQLQANYRAILTAFSQPLDSIAAAWEQDSLFQKIAIRAQAGSLSIHLPEEMIFQRNSQRLLPQASLYFQRIADLLQQNPRWNITILGHTDNQERRRPPYNWAYSAERAVLLGQELADNYFISTNRISTVGKGDSAPLQSNATEAGRAANRRIEFRLSNSLPYLLQTLSNLSRPD